MKHKEDSNSDLSGTTRTNQTQKQAPKNTTSHPQEQPKHQNMKAQDPNESEDGDKYVEHDIQWDANSEWNAPKSRPERMSNHKDGREHYEKGNAYHNGYNNYNNRDYQQQGYNQRGRRGGYSNNRDPRGFQNYGNQYPRPNYYGDDRGDYRNTEAPYKGGYGRNDRDDRRNDGYYSSKNKRAYGNILDNQPRKTDFTSIAEFFSKRLQGDQHDPLMKWDKDPGPKSVKMDSKLGLIQNCLI